jgi:hypothetical protein
VFALEGDPWVPEDSKLVKTTLAIGDVNAKRVAVTIPAGDSVNLIAGPKS